ncbi:hypothetical protein ACR1PO_12780 [Chryseobacterium sp. RRHN12]|uniref:hypothetical protein n=1 Tax=Chryseobacterium sp. RRHN12 TaxID=3437884 RepID=UPI003D9BA4DA
MISKEEENQIQKITPSRITVHWAAAYIVSEKKIRPGNSDDTQSFNAFIVNGNDHKRVLAKNSFLIW